MLKILQYDRRLSACWTSCHLRIFADDAKADAENAELANHIIHLQEARRNSTAVKLNIRKATCTSAR